MTCSYWFLNLGKPEFNVLVIISFEIAFDYFHFSHVCICLLHINITKGKTPLHYAAENEHANIVSELLDRGAYPNVADIFVSYGLLYFILFSILRKLIRSIHIH